MVREKRAEPAGDSAADGPNGAGAANPDTSADGRSDGANTRCRGDWPREQPLSSAVDRRRVTVAAAGKRRSRSHPPVAGAIRWQFAVFCAFDGCMEQIIPAARAATRRRDPRCVPLRMAGR
jgi:hypothetical protein